MSDGTSKFDGGHDGGEGALSHRLAVVKNFCGGWVPTCRDGED